MSGWGSSIWGSSPWGGAPSDAPTTLNAGVSEINIFAIDLLEVVFAVEVKATAALLDIASYSVTPFSTGVAVGVLEVRPVSGATDRVYLVVTPFTAGAVYDVAVLNTVYARDGRTLVGSLTARMEGRRTKIDIICSTRPPMYSLSAGGVVRNILNAIGREDDRIGGSQDEGEEIIR